MWPTPLASTGGPYKNHKGDEKKIPSRGNSLATAVAMWPTPRARDWKMTGDVSNWAESAIGDECLRRAVGRKEATPGSLNPQWVEWLMGYPEGWTDLKG
jgi:DNA (cytosine-5)-methyltransferase 1